MRKLLVIAGLVLILSALVFSGCNLLGGEKEPEPKGPGTVQEDGGKDKKDYYIGQDAPVEGIKDWTERYRPYEGVFLQKLDGYRTVLVSMGEKFSPGYDVKVDEVAKKDGNWVVEVSFTKPAEEDYSGASVFPYETVSIIDDDSPVEVYETGKDNNQAVKLEVIEIPEGMKLGASKSFIVFLPREGEKIANPVTVRGKARVFEATFRITVEDGHNQLAREFMTASEGAPGWGEFEVDLSYEQPTNPAGHIIFSYENMENGELIEELALPVKF
ncbi:MAG: hypothetical protein CVU89_15480 [Firmicutes bacterium HGW-Firmicutes-14]|nr:MAG: hypothetical protein CVU89_15480 [Firmicutes bacterium HGW-Firmicutes-14]